MILKKFNLDKVKNRIIFLILPALILILLPISGILFFSFYEKYIVAEITLIILIILFALITCINLIRITIYDNKIWKE